MQFSSALSSSSTSAEASEQRAAPASLSSLLEVCVDGRCSRRLQWEEVELLVKAGRLEALGRLDHQLADYAKSKAAMLCDYHSVVDRLREHRLGAPCRLVDGRKKCDWTEEAEDAAAQQQAGAGGDGQTAEAGEANHELAETDEGKQIRLCWYPKSATGHTQPHTAALQPTLPALLTPPTVCAAVRVCVLYAQRVRLRHRW